MYYSNEVISYLQSNKILALKLDRALRGVGQALSNQIETTGAGAKRALYYISCFTDEYQDVCQRQKNEDIRFRKSVIRLLQHGNVVYDILRIYFEEIFKYKTSEQIAHIKKMLMVVNVHIAASYLTVHGFALAVASAVAIGMNLSLDMSAFTGRRAGGVLAGVSVYGIVQKAADSARRLHCTYPSCYAALYAQELEMMYFLLEPLFERAGAVEAQGASNQKIADIITRMVR
ncbi:hypothetical protein [Dryocola sp. BD586]|uniref:hypothetical protein n=1 Tax=Dryocola sp. BD586 TaxID=3133271 RepID=UPI003F50B3CC